jgi:2-polyprenyl-3-methyl-5-hydroxy-6-metoxy-1,4-benzoquinol methylase
MGGQDGLFSMIPCVNCGSLPGEHETLVSTKVLHHGRFYGAPLVVVVCPRCGMVFLNPQPKPEMLAQFYQDDYYGDSDKKIVDIQALIHRKTWQRDVLYSWLVRHLQSICGYRILDIGAGYGIWLRWFDESNEVFGLEPSTHASESASKYFGHIMYQKDLMTNGLQSGKFDLLTGLAVIEHFSDPLAALIEMNRLLRPKGYLFLQTPNLHGLVLRRGIERYFKLVHTYYFSPRTLSSLLEKAGFEVVALRERPPLIKDSRIWNPDFYWVGEIDILACKKIDVHTLDEAKLHPASSDDASMAKGNLMKVLKRDQLYLRLAACSQHRITGIFIRGILKLVRRIMGAQNRKFILQEPYITTWLK